MDIKMKGVKHSEKHSDRNSYYKQFLIYTVVSLLVMAILYMLLFSLQFGPYIPTEYWIRDACTIKRHIATPIKEKKIVVISGSNGLFGIDSRLIQERSGLKTVNMSLHAGLSPDFLLDPRKYCLKTGDIVIMPLEYHFFTHESRYNNLTVESVIAWDKDFYDALPFWKKVTFVSSGSPLRTVAALFQKYIRRYKRNNVSAAKIISAAEATWREMEKCESNGVVYSPGNLYQNFDRYGDVIGNNGGPKKFKLNAYGLKNSDWEISSYSRESIRRFADYCRTNGIAAFFSWPSAVRSQYFDPDDRVIQSNLSKIKNFLKNINLPILGEPGDFELDHKYFYDTNYHLNQRGRIIRTQRLMDFFAQYNRKH